MSTTAVITIRLVKSFEYRTFKNLIIHEVPLSMTVGELVQRIHEYMQTKANELKPFLNVQYDTLKIYTQPYGSKSANLIINLEHDDELILSDPDVLLSNVGIQNETELSYFNRAAYEAYKANPQTRW